MALTADAQGKITGRFTIPPNVSAGSKAVDFLGSGGSHATASFFGQGTLVENVMQKVMTTTITYYDPLAQTFFLNEMRQLVGVELFVEAVGASPIIVHLRETSNGYPTQTIIAEASLQPGDITVDDWNRWEFDHPITLLSGVEYAVVVMCNDADAAIAIAELGKWSESSQRWVTSQSPNVGVLLSSSNNSTWTAHQDRDMAMRLLAARYTQTERTLELGTIAANGHTDALVLATADTPTSGTSFAVELEMPDGAVIESGDSQALAFNPAATGDIELRARITATEKVSALLFPGTQLALGTAQLNADYVSRAFDADAASSNVRITYDANVPSGATVKVYLADEQNPPAWEEVPLDGAAVPLGNGTYQFQHYKAGFNKAKCRVRLELAGTNAARPRVMNLRASVTGA